MRKIVWLAVFVVAAAPLYADMLEMRTATANWQGGAKGDDTRGYTCEVVYENMDYAGGYYTSGHYDDYDSILEGGDIELCEVSFIGGVQVAGQTLFFDFFYPDQTWATGFSVSLSEAGNYIWSIGLGDCPTEFFVPEAGIMMISKAEEGDANFAWFYETTSAEIGTEDIALYGPDAASSWCFSLSHCVPEPASLMLLGMGLLLVRRR